VAEHPTSSSISPVGGHYAIVPERLLDSGLSDRAIRVWALLDRYANKRRECWPSRNTLAKRAGCSVRSVDRAIDELEAAKWLKRERRTKAGTNEPDSNFYKLLWGSDTGALGSDTGALGSDTGALGSDTGALGSDTGALGSDTGGERVVHPWQVGSATGGDQTIAIEPEPPTTPRAAAVELEKFIHVHCGRTPSANELQKLIDAHGLEAVTAEAEARAAAGEAAFAGIGSPGRAMARRAEAGPPAQTGAFERWCRRAARSQAPRETPAQEIARYQRELREEAESA